MHTQTQPASAFLATTPVASASFIQHGLKLSSLPIDAHASLQVLSVATASLTDSFREALKDSSASGAGDAVAASVADDTAPKSAKKEKPGKSGSKSGGPKSSGLLSSFVTKEGKVYALPMPVAACMVGMVFVLLVAYVKHCVYVSADMYR